MATLGIHVYNKMYDVVSNFNMFQTLYPYIPIYTQQMPVNYKSTLHPTGTPRITAFYSFNGYAGSYLAGGEESVVAPPFVPSPDPDWRMGLSSHHTVRMMRHTAILLKPTVDSEVPPGARLDYDSVRNLIMYGNYLTPVTSAFFAGNVRLF